MKFKTRVIIFSIFIILFSVGLTVSVIVYSIKQKEMHDIEDYKSEETQRISQKLKNLVDVAYTSIDANLSLTENKDYLESRYGPELKSFADIAEAILIEKQELVKKGALNLSQAQAQARKAIGKIRYNGGTGYIWINDTGRPIPKMIMHPILPELDGAVLDSPKYRCALGRKENLFKAAVDIVSSGGEGFIDYKWPKPSKNGQIKKDAPKLSYIRLFKPWGWILGTGVYIEDAIADAIAKSKEDIVKMKYDNGKGYFWINDIGYPFPKMVVHPIFPSLNGKILNDPVYNCALGKGENLFKAFVDVTKNTGAGFVNYKWPKPLPDGSTINDVPKLSYVKRYKPLGWIIGTGVYTDAIDAMIQKKVGSINGQINYLLITILVLSIFIIFIGVLISYYLSGSVVRPIEVLISSISHIRSEGLTSHMVKLNGIEELNRLGRIFNEMLDAIQKSAEKLTATTVAREKIEHELEIARKIQMGILPNVFPPFPDNKRFDILATIKPAREVGGDLYDFFFVDKSRLCFIIGDVSGKGVPAAFFMTMTKTLLKAVASVNISPDETLRLVNEELCQKNEACMFVTLFIGVLDLNTGLVEYSNGGHTLPLLMRKNGELEYIKGQTGTAAGVFENATYSKDAIKLNAGDSIFLYTDGVTESMNEQNNLFSEERLEKLLTPLNDRPLKEIVQTVMDEVKEFSTNMPQTDDITIMSLRYFGGGNDFTGDKLSNEEIIVANSIENIPKIHEKVEKLLSSKDIANNVIYDLKLVLEEIVTNTIKFGYDDNGSHEINIRIIIKKNKIEAVVKDSGKQFNPLEQKETAFPKSINEIAIGGQGINLIKKLVDDIKYERKGNENTLTFVKKW